MKITLRLATPEDAFQIVDMLEELHEGSNFIEVAPFNWEDTLASVEFMVNAPHFDVILALDEGEVIGLASMMFDSPYYNYDVVLCHGLSFWVSHKYRKTGVGKALYDKAEQLAEARGAIYADVGVRYDNNHLGEYHERNGYSHNETIYRKRLA